MLKVRMIRLKTMHLNIIFNRKVDQYDVQIKNI